MNILLITADQWRGDCLSAVGHPVLETPHIDRLAEQGVLFRKHFTNAVPCSPARACLYTGLYQMNNRVCVNGSPLDARHDTLAKAFRRQGYDPTLFGYTDQSEDPRTHHANDPKLRTYEGLLPGFTWRACLSDDQRNWRSWLEGQGYDNALQSDPVDFHISPEGVDDPPTGKPPTYRAEHTDTVYLVDEFARWLAEECSPYRRNNRPQGWFAHLSFLRPHPPFTVPPPYNTRYSPGDVPAFVGAGGWQQESSLHPFLEYLHSSISKSQFLPGTNGLIREWSDDDFRQLAAIYYGMCAEVDDQVGRLVDMLKVQGERENTIVVFTSDHGEQMGDHSLLGKYGFYDHSFHVPLIVSDPRADVCHGSQVDALTEAVDVMPTLLELVNAEVPRHLDGQSLSPFVTRQGPAPTNADGWRQSVHWEFDFRNVATQQAEKHFAITSRECNLSVMRSERWKYVHFAALPPLLFDLQNDPGETTNLATSDDYHSIARDCAEELLSWRAKHLDQTLAFSQLGPDGCTKLG